MNTGIFAFIWVFGWAILGGLIVMGVDLLATQRKRRRLIVAGLYPKLGTESDEDVQRLLGAGHHEMAVRCYQAVHRVSYQQARARLTGAKPAEYGFLPIGLVFGLSIGLFLRNTALGAGLGLLLGIILALLMKKHRPHDSGPK